MRCSVIVALAGSLVLTACGGDPGDGPETDDTVMFQFATGPGDMNRPRVEDVP